MKYELYDANGNLRSLTEILQDLDKKLSQMTDEEKFIQLNTLPDEPNLKLFLDLLANSVKIKEAYK
ncbi:MAG: phage tail tape measure protein [Firmicutes bacterium]|nr:phage tail tape measure protein [Bacillota bacterium]